MGGGCRNKFLMSFFKDKKPFKVNLNRKQTSNYPAYLSNQSF